MDSVNSKISPERKVRNVCVSMIRAKRDRTEKKMYIHLSKVLRRLKKSKKGICRMGNSPGSRYSRYKGIMKAPPGASGSIAQKVRAAAS